MPLLLVFAFFTILAMGLADAIKHDIGTSSFLVACGIVLVSWGCMLLGAMPVGYWLLRAAFVAACARLVRSALRRELPISQWAILLCSGIICGLIWWICRGRMFAKWDDFSFWGVSLKYSFFTDCPYTSPEFVNGFKTYPPAQMLYIYTVMKAIGIGWREDVVLFLAAFLPFSMILWVVGQLHRRKGRVAAVAMTVTTLFLYAATHDNAFIDLSVDGAMGIVTAAAILSFSFSATRQERLLYSSLALAVLTLYKSSGAPLALCCGVLFAAYGLCTQKAGGRRFVWLLPLCSVVFCKGLWSAHCALLRVSDKWQIAVPSGEGSAALFSGYRAQVLEKFFRAYFLAPSYGSVLQYPIVLVGVVALVVLLILRKAAGASASEENAAMTGVVVLFFVFSFFMLFSYLFIFDRVEAVVLASMHRYFLAPVICTYIVAFFCLYLQLPDKASAKLGYVAIIAALAFALVPYADVLRTRIATASTQSAQTHHDRYLTQRAARYIRQLDSSRIYLITANDAGWAAMLIDYELLPQINLPQQSNIIGCQPNKDDLYTAQLSCEEWSRILAQGFDYVYIYCPETQFVADYLPVFEDESQVVVNRMFRVNVHPDGMATLERIMIAEEEA